MNDAAEPTPGDSGAGRRFWFRRRHRGLPAREERTWIHPSELPSFDAIPAYDVHASPRRHTAILVLAMGLVVLAIGSVTLALRSTTPPATSALTNIATSVTDLPAYAQAAARSSVELVITENGHLSAAAAMVIAPGDLAVTTEPIPADASITGSSQLNERFAVTVVSHDDALGFTVLRLGRSQPITPTNVLPDAAPVLAISPYFTPRAIAPEIAWADTTLGDPVVEQSDGIVSYLATPSAPNLDGFADALAVEPSGDVVAVLSAKGQWFSAQYVTRVAHAGDENGGCHVHMGFVGVSAQGGGVEVRSVQAGPSAGILHAGDIITSINGVQMDSEDSLLEYLYAALAQGSARLGLLREGRQMSVDVPLTCQP